MDWKHERTPTSDDVQVIAAIFPKDGFICSFKPKNNE
jgi:C-22 sterol desaturase